ncbi:GNAT family N-acetyltransferase [Fibrella forsythiae]|uniref:GNAT family N-acetyltransferase n=1 Tax=Fibrella forsythiae TaxID=2817061 RepID=A0ABS3JJ42_9BACT|nr:GNAT family N-acetyltransferase [Fibrella forsythiae]MBO0950028.1 GNAT family N-acetyltransferase [Fibrella forsythiae]
MIIRLATFDDVPALLVLVKRVVPLMQQAGNFQWDDTYPNEAVFIDDVAKQQLWVADVDGQLAGVSAITTDQEPTYAEVGWDINEPAIVTHRLAVDPAFRRQGVARALLLQADEVARQRDIPILRIDTNTQNQATQRLFPALGYVYAGEIGLDFRPGLRFVCYEKRLTRTLP